MNIIPSLNIVPQRKNSVKLHGKHCETPWLMHHHNPQKTPITIKDTFFSNKKL